MHGKGKFQWPDGSSYEGDYQHHKKDGHGRFMFASGNYYEGYFENGLQHGKGMLIDKNSQ